MENVEEKKNFYLKNPRYCCNPFNKHKRTKIDGVRPISALNVNALNNSGVNWVEDGQFQVCNTCRLNIPSNTLSHIHPNNAPQVTPTSASVNIIDQKSPEQHITSSSSSDEVRYDYNHEKIGKLISFLGLEMPEKLSALNRDSRNYRISASKQIFQSIIEAIKSLFPKEVVDDLNNFQEVSL